MPIAGDSKPAPKRPPVRNADADPGAIAEAAQHLRAGRLVAFPTETVYGLGADATNGEAVARIFEAKGRPRFNPLIVHVPDMAAARALGQMSDAAERLAKRFWPGPLTLVVPRADNCAASPLVSAGLDTLALRMPAHAVAQRLLAETGRPLAAPSANRSGHVSATRARHVADDFDGRVAMILDGGPTTLGLESTVVSLAGPEPVVLRPGTITADEIADALGLARVSRGHEAPGKLTAPGQLASHYAPRAAIRLNATTVAGNEALLAFGPQVPAGAAITLNLSPSGDLIEAAAKLFDALRTADASGAATIAVMPIPDHGPNHGLGAAINDRLARAAAPRET